MQPKWLEWAQRLQAVAQTGLTYAKDPFDVERYEAMRELAAEIVATHAGLETPNVLDVFADQAGYATPKLDVRGVVFQDGKLLMVRERDDGKWTLPGGWADVGDSPREAVEREIREESGYETRAVKLLAVVDRLKQGYPPMAFHVYKLFILCELVGGTASGSNETSEVGFFEENDLPSLSSSRMIAASIHRMFEHHRHPELPTDFD